METELQKQADSSNSETNHQGSNMMVSYSAPLPPPAMFAQYNNVVPDAAERILLMAENQSRHRHFIEKTVVIGETLKSWVGLIFAFIIVLAGIGAGAYLVQNDKQISGLVSMFIPLAAVAGAFIYREKNSKDKEND